MWDLPCLLHLLFWFHVSNYHNFWNNKRWKSYTKSFSIMKLFHLQKPLSNGANDMSEHLVNMWNQGRIHVWSESAPAPPFWQINHANSAYFRLLLGYFGVISATRPPFWISAPPFYISWIRPWKQLFVKDLKILYSSDHLILIKFHQLVVNIIIRNYKWYFWLLQLSIAMETWKSWNAKLSVKSWCFDRALHIAVANVDIGSLKCHL